MPNPSWITSDPITHLQLAFDGQWETSLHISRDGASEPDLTTWLSIGSRDLAVEAFYASETAQAFIGVRLATLPRDQQQEVAFKLVERFMAGDLTSSNLFVEVMESLVKAPLFKGSPSFLELGKVNAWRSFGSVVFWRGNAGGAPLSCLNDALAANARYLEPSALPYAIELGFDGSFPHWLGIPISERVDSAHVISEALAGSLLSRV